MSNRYSATVLADCVHELDAMREQRDALRAERDKLREALENIQALITWDYANPYYGDAPIKKAGQVCRAALEGTK